MRLLLFTVSILFLISSCSKNKYNEKMPPTVNTLSEVQELFVDPPVEYRSAPLWVWNDDVTEKQIDRQLKDFQEEGIGGVFIHPRPGLITPYLSERWFELCRYTVDKSKDMGMDVWLYDENSYPSGFAGGHVPAEMPESFNEGGGLKLVRFDKLPEKADKYFLILKSENSKFVDITGKLNQERDKSGDYFLYKKTYYENQAWHGGFSYVDLLHKGVTDKFIELTMTGYEKAIGNEFGKTVKGIFTDEPSITASLGIKWTPDLFSEFKKQHGYDLKTNLPSIDIEVGDWKRVRHDYYATLLDMFIERWSKPWYEYTEKNNLDWTGHYWEHGWPNPAHGSDNMAMYAWHQMPAIDILMNKYSEDVNAQFGNVRSVKELRSVANQMGRSRTLSETYGAGGWDLRFEDMKRIGDWEYVLGVNFMNQHLSYMTIEGARKKDHPQSFSYHEPWWKFYKSQADYFGRLSMVMSSGEQLNDVLVIEPTTTGWMYYSKTTSNATFSILGPDFQKFLMHLEKNQAEYDIGSEDIIKNTGEVKREKFIVGRRAYGVVVIPPALENLENPTLKLLKEYLKNGGVVVSYNGIPSFVNGIENDELKNFVDNGGVNWIDAKYTEDGAMQKELTSDNIEFSDSENIKGKLFHHRRVLDDGQIVFLVNTSTEEWAKGKFTIKGKSVKELDPVTGKVLPYSGKVTGDKIEVEFELSPVGSLLLMFDDDGDNRQEVEVAGNSEVRVLKAVDRTSVKADSPNVLTLDYCDLTLDGKTDKGIYYFKAADNIFRYYGFDGNPWSSAVQYKSTLIDRDTFKVGSGFEVSYPFTVDAVPQGEMKVVIEHPELWQVSINGKKTDAVTGEYRFDRKFAVYDIGQYVKKGENRITITADKMSVYAEVETVYILGNFRLRSRKRGWAIAAPGAMKIGSWKEQGYPFYPDAVSYTKSYEVEETGRSERFVVKLTDWDGSVAEIKVNNEKAGLIAWPPFELDVTDYVIKGKNEVTVLVYGTFRNLLGPHHAGHVSGAAWPAYFEDAPKGIPQGDKYDMLNYGLFRDFLLLEAKGAPRRVYMKLERAEEPLFSTKDTIRSKPFTVSLSTIEPGTEIRYTLNGSEPKRTSKLYRRPISIKKSTVVKARAFNTNRLPGKTVSRKFYIKKKKSYNTSNLKSGLKYQYYEGIWGKVPEFEFLSVVRTGVTHKLNVEMDRKNSNFALRFTGFLKVDKAGDYRFYVVSNDGSKLFIDDILIVDNDGPHGAIEKSGEISLSKGCHPFRLEYFDGGGSQALNVTFESEDMERQEIPAGMLFY